MVPSSHPGPTAGAVGVHPAEARPARGGDTNPGLSPPALPPSAVPLPRLPASRSGHGPSMPAAPPAGPGLAPLAGVRVACLGLPPPLQARVHAALAQLGACASPGLELGRPPDAALAASVRAPGYQVRPPTAGGVTALCGVARVCCLERPDGAGRQRPARAGDIRRLGGCVRPASFKGEAACWHADRPG